MALDDYNTEIIHISVLKWLPWDFIIIVCLTLTQETPYIPFLCYRSPGHDIRHGVINTMVIRSMSRAPTYDKCDFGAWLILDNENNMGFEMANAIPAHILECQASVAIWQQTLCYLISNHQHVMLNRVTSPKMMMPSKLTNNLLPMKLICVFIPLQIINRTTNMISCGNNII